MPEDGTAVSNDVTERKAREAMLDEAWNLFHGVAEFFRSRPKDMVYVDWNIGKYGIDIFREDRRNPILIGQIRSELVDGSVWFAYNGARHQSDGVLPWVTDLIASDLHASYRTTPRGTSIWRVLGLPLAVLSMVGLGSIARRLRR